MRTDCQTGAVSGVMTPIHGGGPGSWWLWPSRPSSSQIGSQRSYRYAAAKALAWVTLEGVDAKG